MQSGPAAFGESAQHWLGGVDVDGSSLIVVDTSGIAQAYVEIVRRKMAGERVEVLPLLHDARALLSLVVVQEHLATRGTYDERRALMDTIAGGGFTIDPQSTKMLTGLHDFVLTGLRELARMADGFTARSWIEAERVATTIGRVRAVSSLRRVTSRRVPAAAHGACAKALVIWAPGLNAAGVANFTFPFENLRLPMVVVGDDPGAGTSRITCVRPQDAGPWLAEALAVIDASLTDPAAALALAAHGVPLAVASTSGAFEWLVGAFSFDPWDHRSIAHAANEAMARGPARLRLDTAGRIEVGPVAARPRAQPRVSIVVPTFNRPADLERALWSLERQRYTNLEMVVVNDAGTPVNAVTERFSRTVVVNHAANRGLPAARNSGVRAASGDFVGFLDDDDVCFPNFVPDLASALVRTGARIAHGHYLIADARIDTSGRLVVDGFSLPHTMLDVWEMLVQNTFCTLTFLVARSAFEEVGFFDEALPVCEDYEQWLRFALHYDAVAVDTVAAMYSRRTDKTSLSGATARHLVATHRLLYERYPSGGSASVEQRRRALVAHWESSADATVRTPSPSVGFTVPVPLEWLDPPREPLLL